MLYALIKSLTRTQKGLILFGMDLLWIAAAFIVAHVLFSGSVTLAESLFANAWYLLILLPFGALVIWWYGLHLIKLHAFNMSDTVNSAIFAVTLGFVGWLCGFLPFANKSIEPSSLLIFPLLFLVLTVSGRIALRNLVEVTLSRAQNRKRVLVYGAGQTGQQLAAALRTDNAFEMVCFVDDKVALQKLTISGMRVHAPREVEDIVSKHKIDRIVLAMPSVSQAVRARITQELKTVGCEVLALPSFAEMVLRGEEVHKSTTVATSQLLGRSALEGELPASSETYKGRRILVTGAGGSIGSELCRQLLMCEPQKLVLLDHSELALYTIERELAVSEANTAVVNVLGSINHPELVAETLQNHEIEVVFHAAAYKHLPLVEENILEGLRNNVIGTRIVAGESRRANVDRFILVSSDKAVRPTSVMGSSKRMAELVVQDLAARSETTRFSMVRFGNVLGSSGSVIPLFEEQIRHGGPLTVTHPDVTRFFMTISEAVRLVLLAGSFSRGGDVFVLDMGIPVHVLSMARKMIVGSGYSVRDEDDPDGDIGIEFTGLRPGEKMHEELLIGSDMLTTPHPKILRAQENNLSEIEIANALQDLRRAIEVRDVTAAIDTLCKWVEDYPSGNESRDIA